MGKGTQRKRPRYRPRSVALRCCPLIFPDGLRRRFADMTKPLTDQNLQLLDPRSRDIFRLIVDAYLRDGEPMGSRNLSRMLPQSLSPVTVRNVMSDLEHLGFIYAPHVSAGRL